VSDAVLRVEALGKDFAGVRALHDISLDVGAHEIVGLVGENGAGKSTLLKLLAGVYRPDRGRVVLHGRPIQPRSVAEAARAGIGMVFQEQSLLPNLSVAENILLGHEHAALRAGLYDWKALRALAAVQLDKLGSRISPSARTDTLSFAERQEVEIAKVLAIEERIQHEPVILLDEPTSMLDAVQVEAVLALIERLRGRASVVFVSHRLDEVLRVCDRVCVLGHGRCVAQRRCSGCDPAELKALMLGHTSSARSGTAPTRPPSPMSAPARLRVRGLGRDGCYRSVNFELHAGEVLGIAGAGSSGRESLCRTLFGAEAPDSGEIVLDGQTIRLGEPGDAVRLGIGYVPAERAVEGVLDALSVRANMSLARLPDLRRGPFIDIARERRLVRHWIERLRIKPAAPDASARDLSGGNQQKLMLARWLIARPPRILILDRPLRGLDVGARGEIASLIRTIAADGIGVLLIADTLEELMTLSDGILAMKDGAVSGWFPAAATRPSEAQILELTV
jgi:ribose transport system ATP-binding protein